MSWEYSSIIYIDERLDSTQGSIMIPPIVSELIVMARQI